MVNSLHSHLDLWGDLGEFDNSPTLARVPEPAQQADQAECPRDIDGVLEPFMRGITWGRACRLGDIETCSALDLHLALPGMSLGTHASSLGWMAAQLRGALLRLQCFYSKLGASRVDKVYLFSEHPKRSSRAALDWASCRDEVCLPATARQVAAVGDQA